MGEGGMGIIYRARHLGLQRKVALKLIRAHAQADGEFFARFRVEARALGALKHPSIVNVSDFGVDPRDGGVPYLVMEYLEGETLDEYCARTGRLSLDEALPILESIARTIDYAHERQILHRDLKPANVFLVPERSGKNAVKILDFGLARLLGTNDDSIERRPTDRLPFLPEDGSGSSQQTLDLSDEKTRTLENREETSTQTLHPEDRLTRQGRIMGTLSYMAPEILRGEDASRASDIYAFGVIVHEVLVGAPPFRGSKAEIVRGHLELVPTIPPEARAFVPDEVEDAIAPLLAKDPARRPYNAAAAVASLQAAARRAAERNWRAREVPRRVAIAVVLALALATLAPGIARLEPTRRLENWTIDARFLAAKPRSPDPRIVLVTLDDASLESDPTPLANRTDDISSGLEAALETGAAGVAIDFLLPRSWSQSEKFSRLVLRHEKTMTLAAFSPPEGKVIGPECIGGLTAAVLGPQRASALFGFVNLEQDSDGVTRRASLRYRGQDGSWKNTWAARASQTISGPGDAAEGSRGATPGSAVSEEFWIDHTVDRQQLRRVSWKDLGQTLEHDPAAVRGRLVLLGGGFSASGDDFHRVPAVASSKKEVSGLVLQSLILNTILGGRPIRNAGMLSGPAMVFLVSAVVVAFVLCRRALRATMWLSLGAVGASVLGSIALFRWTGTIFPIVSTIVCWSLAIVLALVLRRRLPAFPSDRWQLL